jgi:hypothetical protein
MLERLGEWWMLVEWDELDQNQQLGMDLPPSLILLVDREAGIALAHQ